MPDSNAADKLYITADELLSDSFQLGLKILDSGYRPTHIVGIWRGGTPVGIAVQEILDFCGVKTDHISIRTSHYTGIGTTGTYTEGSWEATMGASYALNCPAGTFITQLYGRAGAGLDEIGIACQ